MLLLSYMVVRSLHMRQEPGSCLTSCHDYSVNSLAPQ
jgi:hypothetical protein